MEKVLFSRKSLAERWDFSSIKVIEKYENEGILTRIPNLPSPRYSIDEIEKIESLGQEINPLSPIERRRLEREIELIKKERDLYKSRLDTIKAQLTY